MMKEEKTALEARRKRVKDAIEKGHAIVDKTIRQTYIDQHLDTLSNINYLSQDIDYAQESMSGYRAIENYLERIKADFNETELTEIKDALNLHCAKIIEKWNKKIEKSLK